MIALVLFFNNYYFLLFPSPHPFPLPYHPLPLTSVQGVHLLAYTEVNQFSFY